MVAATLVVAMLTVTHPYSALAGMDGTATIHVMVRLERTEEQRLIRILIDGDRYLRSSTIFLDEYDTDRKTWEFDYTLPEGDYHINVEVENNRKKITNFYHGVCRVL